jgi:hypothetical protein
MSETGGLHDAIKRGLICSCAWEQRHRAPNFSRLFVVWWYWNGRCRGCAHDVGPRIRMMVYALARGLSLSR